MLGVAVLTSSTIKFKARELGFDLCGVAPANDFPELAFLREWIARGYAGEMAYIPRSADRRADVRAVVPGARSVVVTGTIYNTVPPYASDEPRSDVARISRYAWGDDYHDVLKKRLEALLAWMRAESSESFDARAYVDTGPVQERVYAQHAGLGWVGKNGCLISPEVGSWLFLSEIICTLPLEPDAEVLDQCGTCTRCLDACPTGALVAPGVLDATRCLSYLTIEIKGASPAHLRNALGAHVYGCDICQDVCPVNHHSEHTGDPVFLASSVEEQRPDLLTILDLDDAEFERRFRSSPVRRATRAGLQRNACVALGNAGDTRAVPSLARVLREGEALVRSHAAWALGRIGGVTAQDALAAASRREADREVLEELALAIEALR